MATIETIDITTATGSNTFPLNANDVYGLVETIASQNIRNLKSSNRIEDGFYEYPVEHGAVIQEAVIEMAQAGNFVKTGNPSFAPIDPALHVLYFNNWEAKQFPTTIRRNDIRKIIANKGVGVEEVVSQILGTLSEGEGFYDYGKMRAVLESASVGYDASTALFDSKVPASSKGILFCLREMYNAVKATNALGTSIGAGEDAVKQATPIDDIRIAVSESVLNLIDVTELANVFNLSKEELFGKLVVLPLDDNYAGSRVLVYDRKAFGRGTRLFEYSQDVIGKGLYTNHYLTTERCYFYNSCFKCLTLDVSKAIGAEKATLLTKADGN